MSEVAEEASSKKYLENNASYQSIPDDDCEMACSALQEFESGKYEQCLGTLKKLLVKRPQDSKVIHNIRVAEYYISEFKQTDKFNSNIIEVCQQAHIDINDIEALDDVDNCVILYNQAVVLYHLHQYHAALSILSKIIQFVEPLDEALGKKIFFLLFEVYLCTCQPRKCLHYVPYFEALLHAGNKNCARSTQREKENQKDDASNGCIPDTVKRRLQLIKAKSYAMIKTSKACKREIKNLMSSGSGLQNIAAFYLKSQLEYQRGNYRKALKLLNSVAMPEDFSKYYKKTGDCLPTLFYNNVGCIHFYMGKPHLGQFYTRKALEHFEREINYLTDISENQINSRNLHLMGTSTRFQLLYNMGMHYLQGRKFENAFHCFVEAIQLYHSNPRLWLRIAECCIYIHKPDNTDQYVECTKKSFIKAAVGSGIHRKLILSSPASDKLLSDMKGGKASPTMQFAMLALKNALALLPDHSSNVNKESCFQSNEENEVTSNEENILITLPANFLQNDEILSLRNSILVACSYVSLSLGDITLAHEYAETLLSETRISGAHKFLAHLYAGEALLLMDRITEAVDHLHFQQANDIELAFPASSPEISLKHQMRLDCKSNEKNDDGSRPVGNIPNWFPNTLSSAKFISLYNLAVAYSLREEWSKATECISQMNPGGDIPPQALSLLIYIHYHQGATDDIKLHLKQCLSINKL